MPTKVASESSCQSIMLFGVNFGHGLVSWGHDKVLLTAYSHTGRCTLGQNLSSIRTRLLGFTMKNFNDEKPNLKYPLKYKSELGERLCPNVFWTGFSLADAADRR